MLIRYIRDTINGSSINSGNHWVQIAAWLNGRSNSTITDVASNVAYLKTVTSTDTGGSNRTVSQIVDGDTASTRYFGGGSSGSKYVQVDLGASYDIEFIQVWHFYSDSRIYNYHTLEVSTDGSTWINIQQQECNRVEKSEGTSYYLPISIASNNIIQNESITSLRNAVTSVRQKRGLSTSLAALTTTITAAQITDLKNQLTTNFGVTFSQSLTDNEGRIEAKDIKEIVDKLYLVYNSTTCNSGCTNECRDACSGMCYGTCALSCGGACAAGCGSNCTSTCGSGCLATCGATCAVTCAAACAGGCAGACAGAICGTACQGACGSGCSHACGSGCYYSCGSGCAGTCNGCSGACDGAVQLFARTCASYTCTATCANSCNNVCSGACAGGCSGACKGGCASSCAGGTCGANCTATCGSGCYATCGSGCTATCGAACAGGCAGTCAGTTCGTTCAKGCGSACQSICGTLCASGCESACTGACSTTCVNAAR